MFKRREEKAQREIERFEEQLDEQKRYLGIAERNIALLEQKLHCQRQNLKQQVDETWDERF